MVIDVKDLGIIEHIWTGEHDLIIGYDQDEHEVIVQGVRDRIERRHRTNLEYDHFIQSTCPAINDAVLEAIKRGFPAHKIDKLPYDIIASLTKDKYDALLSAIYEYEHGRCDTHHVASLACAALIYDGRYNIRNVRALREAGYAVYTVEKDSFGPLSACIRTRRGEVVFG